MLSTVHLLTFLTVAEEGTYSAAAERLHLTQPAISQQIRLLEKQLGEVHLFRRVAQRMVLTHAGEELLPIARDIVQLAERAEESLLALRGQISGRVVVACSPYSGVQVLPALLHLFRELYPAVQLQLEIAALDQVQTWLIEQRVHIGLLEEPIRRRGWENIHVAQEALVCCVPLNHAWLAAPLVTVGMLRDVALILPPLGTPLRKSIDDSIRRAGLAPGELTIALQCESAAATVAAIQAGLGIGWVPQSCQPPATHLTVCNPDGLHIHIDWYLVGSKDPAFGRAIHDCRAFLAGAHVRTVLQRLGLAPVSKA